MQLTGPDAANLSNIQYGIPGRPGSFAVPLNSSPTFTNLPPGTFTVSVVADCGGATVGRSTTVTVPGNYKPPTWRPGGNQVYGSLNCMSSGGIGAVVNDGIPPYVFELTGYPASYTGPRRDTVWYTTSVYFQNLPPGTYTMQVVDSCRNGTVMNTFVVPALNPSQAPVSYPIVSALSCDTLIIDRPAINPASAFDAWAGWRGNPAVMVSYSIPGILGPTTPVPQSYSMFYGNKDTIVLPPGTTLRNLYNKPIIATMQFPCGPPTVVTFPNAVMPNNYPGYQQHCDSGLNITLPTGYNVCGPITYTVRNLQTNAVYGPYVVGKVPMTLHNLPIGNYMTSYVSGDGYRDSSAYTAPPKLAKPYTVTVLPGNVGLNNYIHGFRFTDNSGGTGGSAKTVELFSGPAGYTFKGTWNGLSVFNALVNHSPAASTIKFPAGSYVWKVTDACGVYYIPITVTSADLWQYTAGQPLVVKTCSGISVYPSGTSSNQGAPGPVYFMVFKDGTLYNVPGGGGTLFQAGVPINLSEPGAYTFVTTASTTVVSMPGLYNPGGVRVGLPNLYNSSASYVYVRPPLAVDFTRSQAFVCAGGGPGTARIDVTGINGMPFSGPSGASYKYHLAAQGKGLTGPWIDSNFTGIFTAFGGSAGGVYDVRVTDSCGAFVVQEFRVLDLGLARLAMASKYVACAGDSVVLSAAYLPNATYSWTGPNGFVSSLQNPVIPSVAAGSSGKYAVTITTTACNGVLRDSVRLAVNPLPAKPVLSHVCLPRPVTLIVTNPAAGVGYIWDYGVFNTAANTYVHGQRLPSNLPYTRYVDRAGSWKAVATDSLYGCSSLSDSLVFPGQPYDTPRAVVYTPHTGICIGDSTILAARWGSGAAQLRFQWLRNGSPIPGATAITYTAKLAGDYSVIVDAGLCNRDTSDPVSVTTIPPPSDSLSASRTIICVGETAILSAAAGPGYGYIWELNGTAIPGAFRQTYPATQPGTYTVQTTNGACLVRSRPVTITQVPGLDAAMFPSGAITVCSLSGDTTLEFLLRKDASWRYAWYHNGVLLQGDTLSSYRPRRPGSYHATITSAYCGPLSTDTATVTLLPTAIDLGPDTLICEEARFPIRIVADAGYASYAWSTGATERSIMAPGTGYYSVTATNRCGRFSDTIRIGNGDDFLPKFPDDTLVCTSTQRLVLRLPAGLSGIRWNTGERSGSIYVDTPGRYFVRAYSPCGLVADTVDVSFCRPAIAAVEGLGPICEDQCIHPRALVDGYPETYSWVFDGGTPATARGAGPVQVCYDSPGVFRAVLVVTNKGGSDTGIYTVTVQERPALRFRDTTVLATYNIPIRLPACADARSADWYEDGRLICSGCSELPIQPKRYHADYRCVVRNGDCPDSCSYSLRVLDIPNNVWLPTGFTPNGDGLNDRFGIITDNPNIQVGNLSVYNRWGQRVFLSNRNDGGWDGTFGGRPAEAGVYFWQLSYRILGRDESLFQKGDVTLIR